jgi:hypothetical protein
MRNIHVFVTRYNYNLNNQIFVERNSNNKARRPSLLLAPLLCPIHMHTRRHSHPSTQRRLEWSVHTVRQILWHTRLSLSHTHTHTFVPLVLPCMHACALTMRDGWCVGGLPLSSFHST